MNTLLSSISKKFSLQILLQRISIHYCVISTINRQNNTSVPVRFAKHIAMSVDGHQIG